METTTSWIANLANILANAETEALSSWSTATLSTFIADNEGLSPQPPTWLLALRENVWALALLALWVSGCYALDSDSGPFPWLFVKRRVLRANLKDTGLRKDLHAIRKWVTDHHTLSKEATLHWWVRDLPDGKDGQAAACSRVSRSQEIEDMFRQKFSNRTYDVEPIPFMDEVFVSGPFKSAKVGITSDSTSAARHNDGPYALLPFCSTYRCILGLDASARFTTAFPNVPDMSTTCRIGDIVCFDYNREVHQVIPYANAKQEQAKLALENGGDGHRIALKLHYVVYPRVLGPLGKLSTLLTIQFHLMIRWLFVLTSSPSCTSDRILAFFAVKGYDLSRVANEIGCHNLLYAAALFVVGRLVHPNVFLVGTSFVHYPRYITTFYHRSSDVDPGAFKSAFLFFQAAALSHVGYRYVSALLVASDPVGFGAPTEGIASLALVLAGVSLSILATKALGTNSAFLGRELGVCEMKRTAVFPNNCVPHPMIMCQLVALAGVHLLPEFRAAWPWLAPAHCAFCLVVMLQEIFDVHGKAGKAGKVAGDRGE